MPLTTCLWFDGNAREAAELYVSVFRDGSIGSSADYGEESAKVSGQPEGSQMTVEFSVEGHNFLGLNGGPSYQFSEAISFMVNRETQEEIDALWDALIADGGTPGRCGWLKDKFGVSWQILPATLGQIMGSGDAATRSRVMDALLQMDKLDIAELERAAAGPSEATTAT